MKVSFKINILFYLYALVLILAGFINYLFIFLIIMLFHELGHIMMIKLLGYKISDITIYPYGGVINTDIKLNIRSLHLFLISISGVLMQLLLFLIPLDKSYNYDIFVILNSSLIIYNLLPIIPLDGYKILLSLNENIFSYRFSIIIGNILSIIFLFIFFILTRNIIIFTILYIYNISNILNMKYLYNKFLLERYLYNMSYKGCKYIKDIDRIYKCRQNYILSDNIYEEERVLLKRFFHSSY